MSAANCTRTEARQVLCGYPRRVSISAAHCTAGPGTEQPLWVDGCVGRPFRHGENGRRLKALLVQCAALIGTLRWLQAWRESTGVRAVCRVSMSAANCTRTEARQVLCGYPRRVPISAAHCTGGPGTEQPLWVDGCVGSPYRHRENGRRLKAFLVQCASLIGTLRWRQAWRESTGVRAVCRVSMSAANCTRTEARQVLCGYPRRVSISAAHCTAGPGTEQTLRVNGWLGSPYHHRENGRRLKAFLVQCASLIGTLRWRQAWRESTGVRALCRVSMSAANCTRTPVTPPTSRPNTSTRGALNDTGADPARTYVLCHAGSCGGCQARPWPR